MQQYNWDNFKVRASAIHTIMSKGKTGEPLSEKQLTELSELESKSFLTPKQEERVAYLKEKEQKAKDFVLSDMAVSYLMEEYAWRVAKKDCVSMEIGFDQMQKGKVTQSEGIKLLCIVTGKLYNENISRTRIENDFLSGEVDVFDGETIMESFEIVDIKSVWDYPGFLKKMHDDVIKAYQWQIKGYMAISGASRGTIANCLVNTPENIVESYKYRLLRSMDVATEESPEFIEKWEVLKNSMYFDDINPFKRVYLQSVEKMTEFEEQSVYDRVKVCRDFLWKFDERIRGLNNI